MSVARVQAIPCIALTGTKKLLPLRGIFCYGVAMQFSTKTKIGGTLVVGLAAVSLACSSKDKNYNPGTVYSGGANAMPVAGAPLPGDPAAQALPPLTPEEIGPTVDYTVKSGDSLWDISRAYKTTVTKIMRVNQLEKDLIMPGQVLKIPTRMAQPGTTPAPAALPKKSESTSSFKRPSASATPPATNAGSASPAAPKSKTGNGLRIQD